ncbi:hypothetical protein Slala03_81570 [Streptomyces lavendulae subsp. lavendulae]|uniref:DUF6959 family protein n=1 Tax=Streptomyces lavendulae TaxID=1914 RepID=UPI00249FB279|nr:hypothetical protein [Streptomyces lavendulae]GLV88468.1 hypothetical protein Slala03_81570 [Streptomyces lavendulae subsp. lavendulae]
MERIEVELFTDPGNDAVVRLPPRNSPGVLIQGDSLSIIRADVAEIVEACDQGDVDQAREAAAILLSNLDELLARYTQALKAHDIPIPFCQGH